MPDTWIERANAIATGIRMRVLEYTISQNGGYLSQACSSAELFSVLFCKVLHLAPLDAPLYPQPFSGVPNAGKKAETGARFLGDGRRDCDTFVLSPAQYALVLYAALIESGRMDERGMKEYNRDGSSVEMIGAEHSPGMEVTTGSLGQGISQAAGIAYARKLRHDEGRVIVFLSDGECQSGEFWEALQVMSYHRLDNMLLFVDMNGFQCDGKMSSVMNIEPFQDRIAAFGAQVFRIDGHDPQLIAKTVQTADAKREGKPTFILCDTDPCRGMEILRERYPKFHYVRFACENERARYQDYYEAHRAEWGR